MRLSGHTALYGVVGHPVSHSRSPAMQGAAFESAGIDAVYVPLPVPPDRLWEGLRGAHALGFAGLNVTVPHKRGAVAACAKLDPVAEVVGAVNTLHRTSEGWDGFNTDALALRALLGEAGVKKGSRALVLGAGGAARAAVWALLTAGVDVRIAARRREAAEGLAAESSRFGDGQGTRALGTSFEGIGEEAKRSEVIVNATSVGLLSGETLPLRPLEGQVVVDFVYGTTALSSEAREAGARLISGEEILVRQGALAFEIWTGLKADEPAMAHAVREKGRLE